jgi:hypothetical protein
MRGGRSELACSNPLRAGFSNGRRPQAGRSYRPAEGPGAADAYRAAGRSGGSFCAWRTEAAQLCRASAHEAAAREAASAELEEPGADRAPLHQEIAELHGKLARAGAVVAGAGAGRRGGEGVRCPPGGAVLGKSRAPFDSPARREPPRANSDVPGICWSDHPEESSDEGGKREEDKEEGEEEGEEEVGAREGRGRVRAAWPDVLAEHRARCEHALPLGKGRRGAAHRAALAAHLAAHTARLESKLSPEK